MSHPLGSPCKLQEPQGYLDRHSSKRLKLGQPTSVYWDNLSKIWLTKDALRELNRQNGASNSVSEPHIPHRPLTRQLQARLQRHYQTLAPNPLIDCKPESLSEIRRFSRLGGPDLSDLRNFPDPYIPFYQPMSQNSSRSRKRRAESPSNNSNNKTTKTTSTTAYNRNFEQKLIDHGIYPDGYEYPDGQLPVIPNNLDKINKRLIQPRSSLSPSKFSKSEFRKFKRADTTASKEKPITRSVLPVIDGDIADPKCIGGDYPFRSLAPLTDGTLANAKPDHFFGARPEQLNSKIRDELSEFIIPSTQSSLPMAPNFFLETKGPDGSLAVISRQACYHGALGARGIHKLQSYKQDQDESIYDNNAYTITSTYHGGTLKIYTTHPTMPREKDDRPEYIMTQLNAWSMVGNIETFRQGASAYRNARDWAKEQRDKFIKAANERYTQAQSETPSTSIYEVTSEPIITLEESDTTTSDSEFHDAAWSFAQPDGPQASSKHAERAKPKPTNSTSRKSLQN